ncbi:response regulator transcription factor [Bacillus sp. FJAT-50079]|uniref:response regulator transcription factor n=1 Tax=Bacillus sp. FJAT-50079 TaxID=2833577 RepID=UPI001BCA078B|nr:response regulator transcription factor [Bacillus sp. FJAT-50079]MBS4206550.1 response regulator transcription factor [Bacillus sp. FJAT-50079]
MKVKILLVEDQLIVRKGLRMIVEQEELFIVVAEAGTGEEAMEMMEKHEVDVVLMDIRMPQMNGIEATKWIKQRWPHVKILVLTTFNDDEAAMETLKDGASGFLLKTAEPEKLIQAVHSCLKGGLVLNEEVAARMVPRLLDKRKVEPVQVPFLTTRELEIAKLVGEGKTNKEIASHLYLSVGTVKNHITQILQQLNLRDRTQLAIYAVKNNLV